MPRFFTGEIAGDQAFICGEDARHIALSLRMKVGERVTVCDSAGSDYQCILREITPERVMLSVEAVSPSAGEPSVHITLFQAMPKGDKMESIVQKAVELGVSRVVPVISKRCISRPDEKSIRKKLERYNKIALEAAKQCGRGRVPEVCPSMDFPSAVARMSQAPLAIIFYENSDQPLHGLLTEKLPGEIAILIGSEGGFEPSEAQYAVEHGLAVASLGSRILRCETAPLAALAAILYAAGEF